MNTKALNLMVAMSLNVDRKSNAKLKNTIMKLNTISRENGGALWRDIAERLSGGERRYSSVNVGKLSSLAADGETIVVAGSVLGSGYVDRKITVSALRVSTKAREKIEKSGGSVKTLEELAEENPKGTNIRIMR